MSRFENKDQIILNFGEILWDQFPDYKRPGGSPFNVSIHLHYLRHHSYLISAVGMDEEGDQLLQLMKNANAPTQFVYQNNKSTGTVTVHIDENKEPSYTINEDVAWDLIPANEELLTFATSVDAFSFATLSQRSSSNRQSISEILNALPKTALRFLDVNFRPPFVSSDVIKFSLHHTDFAKFNESEWQQITHSFQMDKPSAFLDTFNLTGIIITKGGKGCGFYHRDGSEIHEPAVELKKTTGDFVGVGDAFWACLIHHTLLKTDWKIALQKSNQYAAWVAEQKGGIPDPNISMLEKVL